jgi:hypothetical protein
VLDVVRQVSWFSQRLFIENSEEITSSNSVEWLMDEVHMGHKNKRLVFLNNIS